MTRMFIVASVFALGNAKLERVLLDDAVASLGARCLDGSPAAYYFRTASATENASRFVVYFQGGGWCNGPTAQATINSCAARSQTALGSSKNYPTTTDDKGGILSADATINPDFATWNAVWVPYCDGGSFSGNLDKGVAVNGSSPTTIWFRGRAIMHAVARDLCERHSMSKATHVLMDGGSAGGLTALLHADYFRSFLPRITRFGAIGDAGWFRPSVAMDSGNYTGLMRIMASTMNATTHAGCEIAAVQAGTDPRDCVFAPVAFPHLSSDMFVMEAAYDSWQLLHILQLTCSTYGHSLSNCNAQQNTTVNAYGRAMRGSIRAALASSSHHSTRSGAFVSACITHVQSADNEGHDQWTQPLHTGIAPRDAVRSWFFGKGGAPVVIEECAEFPCNPLCTRFTLTSGMPSSSIGEAPSSSIDSALPAAHMATDLEVNFERSPLGVDRLEVVHFTWKLPRVERPGLRQIAAQVVVVSDASDDDSLHGSIVYDSGKVPLDRPEHACNLQASLRSDRVYSWAVRLWTASLTTVQPTATPSPPPPLSLAARFHTGLLDAGDWTASWIRGGTQCRTDFRIDDQVSIPWSSSRCTDEARAPVGP